MLERPSIRVLQALSQLEGNNDFEEVCDWLGKSLVSIRTNGDSQRDEVLMRWNQGASQVLSEFLDKKTSARETLRKK